MQSGFRKGSTLSAQSVPCTSLLRPTRPTSAPQPGPTLWPRPPTPTRAQVKENFERFISSKNTIDDIYAKLHKAEADGSAGVEGTSSSEVVAAVMQVLRRVGAGWSGPPGRCLALPGAACCWLSGWESSPPLFLCASPPVPPLPTAPRPAAPAAAGARRGAARLWPAAGAPGQGGAHQAGAGRDPAVRGSGAAAGARARARGGARLRAGAWKAGARAASVACVREGEPCTAAQQQGQGCSDWLIQAIVMGLLRLLPGPAGSTASTAAQGQYGPPFFTGALLLPSPLACPFRDRWWPTTARRARCWQTRPASCRSRRSRAPCGSSCWTRSTRRVGGGGEAAGTLHGQGGRGRELHACASM